MREAREDEGVSADVKSSEELTLILLGGFVHDVASPLAVLTSNLPVVRALPLDDPDTDLQQTATELREIVEDLELATVRLRELTSDLRLYVGASTHDKSLEELVRTALRLGHSHLSRRADVTVDIDPALRTVAPPQLVLRVIAETIVAITLEPKPSVRHRLEVRARPTGLQIELSPPPSRDPSRTLEGVAGRIGSRVDVSLTAERLHIEIALQWAGRGAP
ncbi:MAG: hypothetical protein J0L92_23290 [Deltaproteobacteria bacterium]|nr:hypothetical protein [Deltaproteobacteria bacterium]